jgi:hypothetical protein
VIPSSTQFLFLNRTESAPFHGFNRSVFQQNRPITDIEHALPELVHKASPKPFRSTA